MPFALLIIGAVLLIAAARGTQDHLFSLAQGDFTGPDNFIYWVVAILVIGSLGYIPKVKSISVALIALVMVVLVLTNGKSSAAGGGFFGKFVAGIQSTTAAVGGSGGPGGAAASQPAMTVGPGVALPKLPTLQGNPGVFGNGGWIN